VLKDELRQGPARSDFNPKTLPEVSIVEARVREISAVTFPGRCDRRYALGERRHCERGVAG